MSKEDMKALVNFDAQGWPLYKASLIQLIELLGGTLNEETNMWEIPNDPGMNQIYPRTLEDDGMGYGINEKYIVDAEVCNDGLQAYCNLWVEEKLKNAELFGETETYPGYYVDLGGKTYCVSDFETDGDKINVVCYEIKYNKRAKCKLPDFKGGKAVFDLEYFKTNRKESSI